MNRLKLGESDLEVPELCFGGNVFGWTINEKESLRMLDELQEKGLTFIDTSNNYSHWAPGNVGGESEAIIGKWFKESKKRHNIVLSTKVGGSMKDVQRGLSRDNIRMGVESSLRRLNTDYIDLYFAHHDDLNVSQEETMSIFNDLVREGKVRYLGASNLEVNRIKAANELCKEKGWTKYIAIQPLYNLYDREKYEKEYLPLVKEESLAVMSYFALASGFLTGKYKTQEDISNSQRKEMVKGYLNERGLRIIESLSVVANRYQAQIAEVAIAWQIHKPDISTPIVSATNAKQLESIIKATSLKLTMEDMLFLEKASEFE